MEGIRDQRQKMNLPFGMSELDLIAYSPTLYDMYRNEGEGWDKDAFRYDPVVANGMLASDYELSRALAWVNYLTPESLERISPGDNLVIPTQTFDNYEQLPPWEKRMSHDLSYTGNKNRNNESSYSANLLNSEIAQMGEKINFVGDFSYYFDRESRLVGGVAIVDPAPAVPGVIGGGVAPAGPVVIVPPPTPTPTPGPGVIGGGVGYVQQCTYTYGDWGPCVNGMQTRPVLSQQPDGCTPLGSGSRPITSQACVGYGFIGYTQNCVYTYSDWSPCVDGIQTRTVLSQQPAGCSALGSIPVTSQDCSGDITGPTDPNGGLVGIDTGAGAGGFGGGGGGGAEQPAEEQPQEAAKDGVTPEVECALDYKPIIIGLVAGLVIAYLIAKNRNKDVKTFGILGAIIGGILGFVYVKHQCKPIAALSKIGIKSRAESGYYGGL